MNPYVKLAKEAVENYIEKEKIISPAENLPKHLLSRKSGVFVTIEKNGELRGCIGTYIPTRITIAEEIIRNAVAAATEDYRFDSIKKEEFSELSYTVYVLSYPEPIEDIKELNPKKFGVIVKTVPFTFPNQDVIFNDNVPSKSGLLLPGLPDIDNVEKQFLIACEKGEIDPAKEKVYIYRFTVEKYE